MLNDIIKKIKFFRKTKKEENIRPNQRAGIKFEFSPHTFITRIEDVDKENIYVSAITDKELNFSVPLSEQKLELYIFLDDFYYKNVCTLKKKINQPLSLWVLSKPDKLVAYSERRQTYRFDNVIEADFKISSGLIKDVKQALTKNISIGGLSLVSTANLPLGEKIEVNLSGIGDFTLTGEIVWKYNKPYIDKWYYGVQFLDVDENTQDVISKYINEKLRSLRWAGLV